MTDFKDTLKRLKIVPVITAYDVASTLKLTEALMAGGIDSVEVTLRTSCAREAIKAIRSEQLPVTLGIGTVTSVDVLKDVLEFQPDFIVSPGLTEKLLAYSQENNINLLPGAVTGSEIMLGMEYGFSIFKLFPAVPVGGLKLLSAFSGPFPDISFCPTGGVNLQNASEFLQQKNVVCVGGSWMVSKDLIEAKDWGKITELSKAAMSL